ncbi:MAG TPA: formate/nitrite transporter family protein [Roseiflexaceae bacterium]|jgi:formate/nitrite transporter FocA (FNT family)|nr:formate/nitrite transporter family protein [Roseiflexaceae bacterium]
MSVVEDTSKKPSSDGHAQQADNDREQPDDRRHENGAPNDLSHQEAKQIERRAAPRAAVVYETIRREGQDELERPSRALAWSGLAAGLSMGFSLVAQGLLREGIPDAPWRSLIASFGYSIGFLIVILGRQQLFTENTLTPILPLLANRDMATLRKVLRLWGVVLAANLVGAFIFAWVIGATDVFEPATKQAFSDISMQAITGTFGTILLKGIFAGWLIALMVWLLPFAETARVSVIIIITYLVGVAHLAHSVAGAVEAFYVGWRGEAPWAYIWGGFLVPTVIGNIIGGITLVAIVNYAQVFSGKASQESKGGDVDG